jgi:prepilin-type N-terminal cleavage/methylation domain-containing protein
MKLAWSKLDLRPPSGFGGVHPVKKCQSERGFTILELLIVVSIIGFMAAMALPHLGGFTKSNSMMAATRQLLDDVALARQRAAVNRSEVCMVFLPPNFWSTDIPSPSFICPQFTNLYTHQYSAYALISMRTVGDQPGMSNVHYLTDWRVLPQGIYISPFQFTNLPNTTNYNIYTTNTTTQAINQWPVTAFPTNIFPFPSTYDATYNLINNSNYLPYIGFTPSGQLAGGAAGGDQFILLTSGSILYETDANGLPLFTSTSSANLVETPPGNEFNNPNIIHIDWLTGRAKLERNQF